MCFPIYHMSAGRKKKEEEIRFIISIKKKLDDQLQLTRKLLISIPLNKLPRT